VLQPGERSEGDLVHAMTSRALRRRICVGVAAELDEHDPRHLAEGNEPEAARVKTRAAGR